MAKPASHAGFVGYLDDVLAELSTHTPPALERGDTRSVHRARVATRRFAAALKLLPAELCPKPRRRIAKSLKRIRRSLQHLRDLDVMQTHLADLEQAADSATLHALIDQLRTRRHERWREAHDTAKPHKWLRRADEWSTLRPHLLDDDARLNQRLLADLAEQFDVFCDQADELSEHLLKRQLDHPLDPHALRIAGKRLRYTLEIAHAQGFPVTPALLKQYKQLQDALGLWHDYLVLDEHLAAQRCDPPSTSPVLNPDHLLKLSHHLLEERQAALLRFARLWRDNRQSIVDDFTALRSPPSDGDTRTKGATA